MTREEVKALRTTLRLDLRLTMYRLAIVALADQTYVLLVDGTVTEKVRQVAFYSATEWQERERTLSSTQGDLFGRQGMPASVREQWLKHRAEGGQA